MAQRKKLLAGGDENEEITIQEVAFDNILPWLKNREASIGPKLFAAL